MQQLKQLKFFKLMDVTATFRGVVNQARNEQGLKQLNRFLNERIVFSFLAYRSRNKAGSSVNEISRETRLHKRTVKKVLTNLQFHIHQHEEKWFCNEPPEGHVHLIENPKSMKHWSDRCRYINYYPPALDALVSTSQGSRFGVKHSVVLSMIISFAKQANPNSRLSIQLVSRLTEIHRKTVSSIFEDLLRLEVIQYERNGISLSLTEEHLPLLQKRKPKEQVFKQEETAQANVIGKYEFKDDGFDDYRKLCKPHFVQSHAENAICLARKLQINGLEFENLIRVARARHDENMKSGKCSFSNFGKYVVNWLENQLDEKRRIEKEEKDEQLRQAYLASPEYKAKRAKEELDARANPFSKLHTLNAESITDRVKLGDCPVQNRRIAEAILRIVHLKCRDFFIGKSLTNQESVDQTSRLKYRVMSLALEKLNEHFEAETAATRTELEQAIDEAAAQIIGLGVIFNQGGHPQ